MEDLALFRCDPRLYFLSMAWALPTVEQLRSDVPK